MSDQPQTLVQLSTRYDGSASPLFRMSKEEVDIVQGAFTVFDAIDYTRSARLKEIITPLLTPPQGALALISIHDQIAKEAGIIAEELEFFAHVEPAEAIRMGLMIDPYTQGFDIYEKITVPYADKTPEGDVELLRHVTAAIAGTFSASAETFGIADEDIPAIQCLTILLTTLSRTPGQEQEIQALADKIIEKVESTCNDEDMFMIRNIIPFTTEGQADSDFIGVPKLSV